MQGVKDIIASNEHHAELKIKLLDEKKDITEPGFYILRNRETYLDFIIRRKKYILIKSYISDKSEKFNYVSLL